ncbi:two-component system sensor histidine kinase [Cyclobacterium qasimii M12-11B]|nr:two-component system sensor histidine kinase [Cyclobacterium qasimii M12-11B]
MNSIAPISSLAATINSDLKSKIKNKGSVEQEDLQDYQMGISTIEKRSEGLINFVSDFRSLAHIPNPKFTAINIEELFDRLEILFQNQCEEKAIKISKEILPKDLLLFADCALIEQVLINLTQNAIHAMEETEKKEINLRAYIDDNGKIILEVADTGKGIEEEALNKIFIPFFTTKQKGSGIGLSLSKQIMRRHKGNLQVKSSVGVGTVFKLIFNA